MILILEKEVKMQCVIAKQLNKPMRMIDKDFS